MAIEDLPDLSGLFGSTKEKEKTSEEKAVQQQIEQQAPIDGGFFEDLWKSAGQGWATGGSVGEAFDIYRKGANVSDTELEAYIKAVMDMEKYGPTNEQFMFQKAVEENGGGFFGGMAAIAENPGYLPQLIVSSASTMISSFFDSEEVAATTVAGVGVGAGTGSTGFSLGPLGFATTAGGALVGGVGGLVGAMETGLTLTELLKDELDGKDFNKENIRKILENPEAITRIKNRSLARGVTIGAVEGLTAGLSRGVTSKLVGVKGAPGVLKTKTAKLVGTPAIVTPIEMTGGSLGELGGQIAAKQEIKGEEIFLEGIAEGKGIVNVTDIVKNAVNPTKVTMNDGEATEQDVINFLNDESLTNEEVSNVKINIENNESLENQVKNKQRKAGIGKNLDKNITDSKDREKLIDLEIERLTLEEQKKQKGILKKIGIDNKIENNQSEIDKILSKYEGVDVTKLKEQTRTSVEQFNISQSIAFAETQGKRIGKDVIIVDNDTSAQEAYDKIVAEKGGKAKNVKGADGFIIGDSIVINKEVSGKSGQINVGGHEILHGILTKHLSNLDTNAKKKFINDFKSVISRKSRRAVENYIKENYADQIKDDKNFLETTDEWLTVYSDLLRKKQISFNEGVFTQLRNTLHNVFRAFGYNKEFESGIATYNFMKDYQKSIQAGKLSQRAVDVAGGGATVTEGKLSRSKAVDAVNKMEQGAETQEEFLAKEKVVGDDGKTKVLPSPFDNVYNSIIKEGGAINNYVKALGLSKEKFQKTIDELGDRLINYNPAAKRKTDSSEPITVGEFLMSNIGFGKLVAAKELAIEGKKEGKTTRIDAAKKTKEGETTFDIEDTDTSAQEVLDEQDMSVEGIAKREAKEAKAKKKRYSKLRQELGFETDGDTYNAVLDAARKSILLAYKKTLKITDSKARVDKIVDLIKKEYNSLNSDLFKPLKNFLGTKEYLINLKKFREVIVESIPTADLVQMEKFVPDNEKIFTTFVRKLTAKAQVQDAVDKNLLPKDALNTIDKGEAVNLYQKVMPSPNEFIGFANQPAINPDTGAKSGLKGTRKDGFAKRIAESLILDAVMEVRQETEVQQTLTEDLNVEMDVQQLASKIGREVDVKFSKSNAVTDINNAIDAGINTDVYLEIKFSKSHRDQYESRLVKKRPDLSKEQRENAVQSIFDFVDDKNIPDNKKAKLEKLAMHYTANGYLILPEDGYKVIEAERVATIKKLDAFSYKNPNVLLEENVVRKKVKRTNPDTVGTFSNKTEYSDGVVVYDVEDSKQGQLDTRKVIDTHFGENANPWCICAREKQENIPDLEIVDTIEEAETMKIAFEESGRYETVKIESFNWNQPDGISIPQFAVEARLPRKENFNELGQAWEHWKSYNQNTDGLGFKIAFHNGELVGFRDGKESPRWWDRRDKPSDAPMIKGKKGKDGYRIVSLAYKNKTIPQYLEKVTGDNKTGVEIRKDLDGTVKNIKSKKDGKKQGKQFQRRDDRSAYYTQEMYEVYDKGSRTSFKEVRIYKDYKGKSGTESFTNGRDEIRFDNITKYERFYTHPVLGVGPDSKNVKDYSETITIEGTINQKYFKEFNDPSSITDGFVKTNLQDLTAGYERYYNRQGEKVTLVIKKGETKSITINGVEQTVRTRFSRSAVNEVKFSLSELEQNRKTLPAILKKQIEVEKRMLKNPTAEDLYFLDRLSDLEFAIENNLNYEEAFAMFQVNLPEDVSSLLVDFKDINSFENYVKNISIPAIRTLGLNAAKTYFKNKFDSLTTNKDKVDLIANFLKNIGISVRAGKGLEVSFINQELLDGPIKEIFGKKFVSEHFKTASITEGGKKGKTITYSYDGKDGSFEKVELYKDIENIKNSRGKAAVVKKVNEEAVEANEFIDEIISSDLSISEKIAIIDLLSLNQRGAIRKSYTFGETVTDKVTKPASELVLEHEITVKNMTKYLRQRIKGILTQEQLLEIRSQAKIHVWNTKIDDILNVEKTTDGKSLRYEGGRSRYQNNKVKNYLTSQFEKGLITNIPGEIKEISNLNNLIRFSRSTNNPTKGISILDFDDTLATSSSLIRFTRPDGTEGTLTPEQYASTYQDLLGLDYKFDFSEFNKVVDGKPAPLLNKAKKLAGKFGTDNMFILTARPAESAVAIQEFLKENGLNIPLKNITGLGNSTSEAKALWVLDKAAEGYNDFYFADDAIQNVKAVQNMLDQIDVKSKVQQAKVKFSKSMDKDFNDVLEDVSGIESNKRFSEAKARRRGKRKGKFRFFIPPSHEDFIGLLYNFMGRGEKGNQHRNFFEQALVKPLNRAYRELNAAKQAIANDYKALIKSMPDVRKKLGKKILDGDFTNEDAIRVYLWDKFGLEIPGMSKTDQKNLVEVVKSDPEMQEFADKLGRISKDEKGYVQPSDNWDAGGIKYDLIDATGRIGRAKFFQEFIENAGIIFSKENLNKIEAIYGADFKSALEDMLYRVTKGTNRPTGKNKLVNRWLDWINGSVGATMFFNARSAVLQQLSFVNFMNFADNNVFKAAARFADQKQFWSDFATIFNSDYLKQRRSGAGFDVSSSEIAREVSNAKDPVSAAIRYILNKGFLPTQMGDSFAIAIGGASFLRNRINTYLKQGLSKKEAEAKAFIDFQQIAEATQQSARPDMISQQQASVLGRFILAFQNVTSQYARIVKKSGIDLVKRRKSPGYVTQAQSDMANVSRIMYYGAIQSMVFYGLQTALFAMMFDDDEKDEEFFDKKKDRILNGTLDSFLRGAGVGGAVISTLKNYVVKLVDNSKSESYFKSPAWIELLQISPPISIKQRKFAGGERTADWNMDVIKEMETFDIDNPGWDAVTNISEAAFNVPLNRLYRKVQNLRAASDSENSWWQRVAVTLGWNKWDVGIPDREIEEIKKGLKGNKKLQSTIPNKEAQESENKEKQKQERKQNKKVICAGVTSKGGRCKKEVESGSSYCTIHDKVAKNKSGKKTQCKKMKQVSKKKKERCGMMTNSKSGYCYYHD